MKLTDATDERQRLFIGRPPSIMTLARLLSWFGAVAWWLCLKAFGSRWVYLLYYGSSSVVSPRLEVLAPTSLPALLLAGICCLTWIVLCERLYRKILRSKIGDPAGPLSPKVLASCARHWLVAAAALCLAGLPWLIDIVVLWHVDHSLPGTVSPWGPTLWQPLWLGAFSGLAADQIARAWFESKSLRRAPSLVRTSVVKSRVGKRPPRTVSVSPDSRPSLSVAPTAFVLLAAFLCAIWWWAQSEYTHSQFLIGFNDCGHFAQRVANTAAGRGWLLETPVLPAYWDHFNPGLALMVPLWLVWPSMSLLFIVQAFCLAGCAPLIMRLAKLLGTSDKVAAVWALAWLLQPVLGQMNLGYSYGWHPITLAIPLLLLSLCSALQRRWWWTTAWVVLACSFEEGVIVIVATTAATMAAIELAARLISNRRAAQPARGALDSQASELQAPDPRPSGQQPSVQWASLRRISSLLAAWQWILIAAAATFSFVVIYRFSGLATFQTGRFHSLGDSALEVLASPVLRPEVFFRLLVRDRNAIFLLGLLLPCSLLALARGWPLLLPLVLPVGVLLVWDHLPAQSLAFHYPSTLLPVIWCAALVGATRRSAAQEPATLGWSALVTSLVLSFSFGQMPWSAKTMIDVEARTFVDSARIRLDVYHPNNEFAHAQLESIRRQGTSVLATGRFATHLVGASDLETVGQFIQRREQLSQLTPGRHPLLRYQTLILDRLEGFQQRRQQTAAIEKEARALGFRVLTDQYDIVVLTQ